MKCEYIWELYISKVDMLKPLTPSPFDLQLTRSSINASQSKPAVILFSHIAQGASIELQLHV